MTTFTTHLELPEYGDEPCELTITYDYSRRHRELYIDGCTIQIAGQEVDIYYKLSNMQKWRLEEQCMNDWCGVREAAREARYEGRIAL